MKRYFILALIAFLILGGVAVWWGGLNQDEGWYLYAANLIAKGKMPYRDFFFTQGPVMPMVYSAFHGIWDANGLLGARIFTLLIGALGIAVASALAARLAPESLRREAAIVTFLLLGCNLYHLYYLTIPKTYALAMLLVMTGFLLMTAKGRAMALASGLALAFAAGVRVSLAPLAIVAWLALDWRRKVFFACGVVLGLMLAFGFLVDADALHGFLAAQSYHSLREGGALVWKVGSLSRLVRWYLPVFILLGLGGFARARALIWGFALVFLVQILAPFPYDDYQVPIMGLLAVFAAVNFVAQDRRKGLLLTLGLVFATSFGSPLLEGWMTNGQDRFWSLRKDRSELAQLRAVAKSLNEIDPNGKNLLTQDLYLAIETGRSVPKGLEMGPFAMLTEEEWMVLLDSAPCELAALSGYSFAIEPPACHERPIEQQIEFWQILKKRYALVSREENFGQNATTLLIMKRK